MLLRFTKMHGLGNDFMVLDLVSQHAHILPKHAKQWGDRHTGIGFDQLLIVEAPSNPEVDFRYRIFNSDGSEVEQCGNGARCFARYVRDKGLTAKDRIRVQTLSGVIAPELTPDGRVTVDMGRPQFDPARVPFDAAGLVPVPQGLGQKWPLPRFWLRRYWAATSHPPRPVVPEWHRCADANPRASWPALPVGCRRRESPPP